MTNSLIQLLDSTQSEASRILQLYQHLELYIEGQPPRNSLFVLERTPLSVMANDGDRLLLIDPPVNAPTKFRFEGAVTSIFTGEVCESDLPQLQTQPGGIAHIRMGEHFLDIYTQRGGNVIHFPALGILCCGSFGSDEGLPRIAEGSDGSGELDTLRLLAQLVKRNLRLLIPQIGTLCEDKQQMMQRLAEDVGYLHSLRRVLPQLAERSDSLEAMWGMAATLLPQNRRSFASQTIHQFNVQQFWPHA